MREHIGEQLAVVERCSYFQEVILNDFLVHSGTVVRDLEPATPLFSPVDYFDIGFLVLAVAVHARHEEARINSVLKQFAEKDRAITVQLLSGKILQDLFLAGLEPIFSRLISIGDDIVGIYPSDAPNRKIFLTVMKAADEL